MKQRSPDKALIEYRRRTAVRMKEQGHTIDAIAKALEVDESTVCRDLATYRESGYEGLVVQWSSGRPPKLEEDELRELEALLLMGPELDGFREAFWSGRRIAELVKDHFGVEYHERYVPELLRRMGWSVQKPTTRAVERNDEIIEEWKGTQWRRIRRTAKRRGQPSSLSTKRVCSLLRTCAARGLLRDRPLS
jgi:transposase